MTVLSLEHWSWRSDFFDTDLRDQDLEKVYLLFNYVHSFAARYFDTDLGDSSLE